MKRLKKITIICTAVVFILNLIFSGSAYCMTVKEEERLAEEFMRFVHQHYSLINDPLIVSYVNKVGNRILDVIPPQPFKYHFYVVNEDVFNAFAGPAGHIFINSGLIAAMESEDELAGILGHEIAHVSCRHISIMAEKSKKIGLVTLAGMAAGILLGLGGVSEVGTALITGSQAAGQTAALAYSRENERQADQVGLKYIDEAGYDVAGLLKALRKMRTKTWFGSDEIPTYLSTHPANEERIATISAWLTLKKGTTHFKSVGRNYEFERVRTKLIAQYGSEDIALQMFRAKVEKDSLNPMSHYGFGLALARNGRVKQSLVHLKAALGKKALDPYILKDLGRVYFLDGQYREALKVLRSVINIEPYDPEGHYYLGRAMIETGKYKDAVTTLETLVKQYPDYTDALLSLGEAYYKLDMPGLSSYYLGMHSRMKKEYKNAVFHFKRALKDIRDHDKRIEIEKMLNEASRAASREVESSLKKK